MPERHPTGTCIVCDLNRLDEKCGVVIGQERFVGAGLLKTCQNPRPCPDHPRHSDGDADA